MWEYKLNLDTKRITNNEAKCDYGGQTENDELESKNKNVKFSFWEFYLSKRFKVLYITITEMVSGKIKKCQSVNQFVYKVIKLIP